MRVYEALVGAFLRLAGVPRLLFSLSLWQHWKLIPRLLQPNTIFW